MVLLDDQDATVVVLPEETTERLYAMVVQLLRLLSRSTLRI
jgi:hypothetical protein